MYREEKGKKVFGAILVREEKCFFLRKPTKNNQRMSSENPWIQETISHFYYNTVANKEKRRMGKVTVSYYDSMCLIGEREKRN